MTVLRPVTHGTQVSEDLLPLLWILQLYFHNMPSSGQDGHMSSCLSSRAFGASAGQALESWAVSITNLGDCPA